MGSIIVELWAFMRERKKFWLLPIMIMMVIFGGLIVLTPTEFKILMSLADQPGRVFSREQLVTIAQGYDFEGYDRTIDAHVKNLRHKIEKDSRSPEFIRTVYGIGYKFTGTPDED